MVSLPPPDIGAASDTGRQRPGNEDSWGAVSGPVDARGPDQEDLASKGYLLAVADGMGGHAAGETASRQAIATLFAVYYADDDGDRSGSLARAVQEANVTVYRHSTEDPRLAGMGSTLVAAIILGNRLLVAHVGDSRAYLLSQEGLHLLTQDHTWVADAQRQGLITTAEAEAHERRHVLTRSLGQQPDVAPDLAVVSLAPGDMVLLCSDGLTNVVREEELGQAAGSLPPQEAAQQLVSLANQRGSPDNVTVIVARMPGQAPEESAPPQVVRPLSVLPAPALLAGGVLVLSALFLIAAGAGVLYRSLRPPRPAPTTPVVAVKPRAPTLAATASPLPSTGPGATGTHAPLDTARTVLAPLPTVTPTYGADALLPTSTLAPTSSPAPTPRPTGPCRQGNLVRIVDQGQVVTYVYRERRQLSGPVGCELYVGDQVTFMGERRRGDETHYGSAFWLKVHYVTPKGQICEGWVPEPLIECTGP
ncbi:MAG: serine/threonine-protein phosphatase [Anaerolineae bacterium]|nr:serine/threonine-protein phosphatase [Anaerolineae bacterium]